MFHVVLVEFESFADVGCDDWFALGPYLFLFSVEANSVQRDWAGLVEGTFRVAPLFL